MSKLIEKFGCQNIDSELVARVEKISGKPAHPFLKRGIFFSHRDFGKILDDYEQEKPIYIYTGRGPSAGSFHVY